MNIYQGGVMASYNLKDVDNKLWKEVKILAIKKGLTIQELIVDLLEKAVKKGV
jgi:predicted DNA-binding ribbon-helix-helix protein